MATPIAQANSSVSNGLDLPSTVEAGAHLPSEIQTPTPPTVEVPFAAGEGNRLDPYFYEQFIKVEVFPWTTMDQPGKVLFVLKLDPKNINKQLAYFLDAYYAWGGDIKLLLKVLGTSFHAGQLGIYYLPPGVDYKNYTPQELSIFPWEIVDVKDINLHEILMRDIRPTKYHMLEDKPNDPFYVQSGGTLVIAADTQLSTSSTGVNKIYVSVWSKLAENFQVAYMIPPRELKPSLNFSNEFMAAVNSIFYTGSKSLASAPFRIDTIDIQPVTIRQTFNGIYNCFTTAGENLYTPILPDDYPNSKFNLPIYPMAGTFRTTSNPFEVEISFGFWEFWPKEFTISYKDGDKRTSATPSDMSWDKSDPFKVSFTHEDGLSVKIDEPVKFFPDNVGVFTDKVSPVNQSTTPVNTPQARESIVYFQNSFGAYSLQPAVLAQACADKQFIDVIPQGMAALLIMTEKTSGLPLTYLKFYNRGIFTAPASVDLVKFSLDDKQIKFSNFVLETQSFPVNEEMIRNMLAYCSFHTNKKIMRRISSAKSLQSRKALKKFVTFQETGI
ncbi:hypothetical protein 2 [Wuhan spider virus 5]|uniref:hypothetical protein 2 n=1 Tax=Wuhan spider virus 5 TaxID=1923754 RepID=UPI00090C194C|nr:hypothetical protein 2 [Wuhan spider virus 5]APG77420.1 hypothetical protein 2 [Wuhan spider virus 5]